MEIRAAVLHGPGLPLEIETVQLADPKPGDVLVRIVGSGVCGSDLHLADGELAMYGYPIVPGHEAAGIVEAVGSEVRYVRPGDHVVLGWIPGCGHCATCWDGRPGQCGQIAWNRLYDGETRLSKDGHAIDHMAHVAGYAEYAVVGERTTVRIREDAPLEKVCLVGCAVATGYGSVFHHAGVQPGSSALVIGCGGVGLNVVQCLALAGATTIVAVDLSESKLETAAAFGATHTLGAGADVVAAVQELSGGAGVDYAFEVISTAATIETAFAATRYGGTVVVVGVPSPAGSTITLPASPGRRVMSGSPGGTQWATTPLLVDLYMAGRLKLDELVTKERPLEEANEALDDLRAGRVIRTVLRPNG